MPPDNRTLPGEHLPLSCGRPGLLSAELGAPDTSLIATTHSHSVAAQVSASRVSLKWMSVCSFPSSGHAQDAHGVDTRIRGGDSSKAVLACDGGNSSASRPGKRPACWLPWSIASGSCRRCSRQLRTHYVLANICVEAACRTLIDRMEISSGVHSDLTIHNSHSLMAALIDSRIGRPATAMSPLGATARMAAKTLSRLNQIRVDRPGYPAGTPEQSQLVTVRSPRQDHSRITILRAPANISRPTMAAASSLAV